MKNWIFIIFIITSPVLLAQQLENPGFETWEGSGNSKEPTNWSSLKTATPSGLAGLAPKVIAEAGNAHSGSKCVELLNKKVLTTIAPGMLTNARVHANIDPTKSYVETDLIDGRWNTSLKYRPDSLVGWYKCDPAGADYGTVIAVIHKESARVPDASSKNFIGMANFNLPNAKVSTWTRFSIPFIYSTSDTPEYIILVLASGNGTSAVENSTAHYDDLELIYNQPVRVEEQNFSEEISIYGSQNKITFDLRNTSSTEPLQLMVFDMMGKEQVNVKSNEASLVNFDSMTPGIYICMVKTNNQLYRKKIIVQ